MILLQEFQSFRDLLLTSNKVFCTTKFRWNHTFDQKESFLKRSAEILVFPKPYKVLGVANMKVVSRERRSCIPFLLSGIMLLCSVWFDNILLDTFPKSFFCFRQTLLPHGPISEETSLHQSGFFVSLFRECQIYWNVSWVKRHFKYLLDIWNPQRNSINLKQVLTLLLN